MKGLLSLPRKTVGETPFNQKATYQQLSAVGLPLLCCAGRQTKTHLHICLAGWHLADKPSAAVAQPQGRMRRAAIKDIITDAKHFRIKACYSWIISLDVLEEKKYSGIYIWPCHGRSDSGKSCVALHMH